MSGSTLQTKSSAPKVGFVSLGCPKALVDSEQVLTRLKAEGYDCVAEAHAGLSDNLSYASVAPARIMDMARSLASSAPQAIVCLCTNFPAAVVAAPLEAELGIAVYDTTALGVWHALTLCGSDMRAAAPQWG